MTTHPLIQLYKDCFCQYKDCTELATRLASGASYFKWGEYVHEVGMFCEKHATVVASESTPEYIEDCPNCGCRFGVN